MYRVLMGELVELNMVSPPELTVHPFNSIRIRLAERFGGAKRNVFLFNSSGRIFSRLTNFVIYITEVKNKKHYDGFLMKGAVYDLSKK